jgi:hypothetical protein
MKTSGEQSAVSRPSESALVLVSAPAMQSQPTMNHTMREAQRLCGVAPADGARH